MMRTVGLSEAKRRLSELVQAASRGEDIGITRRGRLAARLVAPAAAPAPNWDEIIAGMEWVRSRVRRKRPLSAKELKQLISAGRI